VSRNCPVSVQIKAHSPLGNSWWLCNPQQELVVSTREDISLTLSLLLPPRFHSIIISIWINRKHINIYRNHHLFHVRSQTYHTVFWTLITPLFVFFPSHKWKKVPQSSKQNLERRNNHRDIFACLLRILLVFVRPIFDQQYRVCEGRKGSFFPLHFKRH